jgi:hypothetical protein
MVLLSDTRLVLLLEVFVTMDALTNSTQKLKLMREGSQSTYTLQHPHSRAAREKGANAAREKGANVEINGWRHK